MLNKGDKGANVADRPPKGGPLCLQSAIDFDTQSGTNARRPNYVQSKYEFMYVSFVLFRLKLKWLYVYIYTIP